MGTCVTSHLVSDYILSLISTDQSPKIDNLLFLNISHRIHFPHCQTEPLGCIPTLSFHNQHVKTLKQNSFQWGYILNWCYWEGLKPRSGIVAPTIEILLFPPRQNPVLLKYSKHIQNQPTNIHFQKQEVKYPFKYQNILI